MLNADYTPLVSIAITSYNRDKWISKAIESALEQDYPNLEIIISDNHSTDNSDKIIKQYLSDSRVKYSRNEVNIGMFNNFEKVFFELSSGEFIVNISSDDYLINKSFISNSIEIVRQYENIMLVFGKDITVNEAIKKIADTPIPEYYLTEFRTGKEAFLDFAKKPYFGWAGCLLSRKKLIELDIHFLDNTCIDIEINLELMMCGNVGYINEEVYAVRVHNENATGKALSANQFIKTRLNLFENIVELYKKIYGDGENIKEWRNIVLQRDIYDITNLLLIRNKKEAHIFIEYIKLTYPDFYKKFSSTGNFFIKRHILATVLKYKFLRKTASFIFPTKIYFKDNFEYLS